MRRDNRPAAAARPALAQRLLEDAQVLERGELIGDRAAVVVVLVHLQRRHARGRTWRPSCGRACIRSGWGSATSACACRPARRRPGRRELAVEPGGAEQLGVGLLVVPEVGVAEPVLGPVFVVVAGHLAVLQDARFQPAAAGGVARLHLERERLHEHRAVGESPAAIGIGRPVRIDDVVELDLRIAGQGQEPLLLRAVGPERRVHRIGNQPLGRRVVLGRGEQARLAQLARERLRRLSAGGAATSR